MDEHTLEKKDGFDRLKADIQSLYTILLKHQWPGIGMNAFRVS